MAESMMWHDGELIPYGEATIHVLSHAANRGSEVFDVLRVVDNGDGPAAIGLRPHVARFDQSMHLMGMEPTCDIGSLEQAVAETVLANPGATQVKLVAVWGEIPAGSRPLSRRPSLYVAANPAYPLMLEPAEPVEVRTSTMPKIPATILPPGLKVAASYTAAIREQLLADAAGFDDVIFATTDGWLAEATTQSVILVDDGRLLAPPLDSVLDGISRRLVLELAHAEGWSVNVASIRWEQVASADEAFFSSTSAFVRSISRIDDDRYRAPGPIATRLVEVLQAVARGEHELSARWLTPLGPRG
ncbi:MAG: aminotransferase class IV [Acidimicrobiales bacterium]